MAKTVEKIADLNYDEIIALSVIENDEDLKKIFMEDVKLSFPMLYKLSKENQLTPSHKELIKELFDHVILTKKELVNKYVRFSEKNPSETIKKPVILEPVITKITSSKKDNKLPRRYGKVKILEDVKKQGGKLTPVQKAMLKVNDLKNIYVNLSARGIKDMIGGTKLLSDSDCREIVSVIVIAERKLENILKRKK